MPRPNPTGYNGGKDGGTFLRQLDGHKSTDRFHTGDSTTDQVDEFQNAHPLGAEDVI